MKRNAFRPEEVEAVVRLYRQRFSYRQICARMRRSMGSISNAIALAKTRGLIPTEARRYGKEECECGNWKPKGVQGCDRCRRLEKLVGSVRSDSVNSWQPTQLEEYRLAMDDGRVRTGNNWRL